MEGLTSVKGVELGGAAFHQVSGSASRCSAHKVRNGRGGAGAGLVVLVEMTRRQPAPQQGSQLEAQTGESSADQGHLQS